MYPICCKAVIEQRRPDLVHRDEDEIDVILYEQEVRRPGSVRISLGGRHRQRCHSRSLGHAFLFAEENPRVDHSKWENELRMLPWKQVMLDILQ